MPEAYLEETADRLGAAFKAVLKPEVFELREEFSVYFNVDALSGFAWFGDHSVIVHLVTQVVNVPNTQTAH